MPPSGVDIERPDTPEAATSLLAPPPFAVSVAIFACGVLLAMGVINYRHDAIDAEIEIRPCSLAGHGLSRM